jgi:exodeoxyribonuclease III
MTLNLLFGGEDRLPALLEIIHKAMPDLLILQECIGWEQAQVNAVASAMTIPASQVLLFEARPRPSGRRFHVTIASRTPLQSKREHADPFFIGHCIAECSTLYQNEPLIVFGAHFDSHHENLRFVEARYLRSQISKEDFSRGAYLLVGDLNSLSPRDPYPPDLAAKVEQAGVEKYGHPPRFEVIRELEEFGWVDTLWSKEAPTKWVTASRHRGGVAIDYRTDYIFASPKMTTRLISTEVIETTGATDHHAVLAVFA